MTSATSPPVGSLVALANEADALIERLRLTSLEALAAARANDLNALSRLVRERDDLIVRLTPRLEAVRVDRSLDRDASGRPSDAAIQNVDRLSLSLRGANVANTKLVDAAAECRDAIASAIEQLGYRAGTSGYQREKSKTGKTIDLTR